MAEGRAEFYLRYYVGHKGKFGHEFLEFEFRPEGLFNLILTKQVCPLNEKTSKILHIIAQT